MNDLAAGLAPARGQAPRLNGPEKLVAAAVGRGRMGVAGVGRRNAQESVAGTAAGGPPGAADAADSYGGQQPALSLEQFAKALAETSLLPPEDLKAWHDSLPPGQRPADAPTLSRMLVEHRKLTKFQASVVGQGKARSLVFDEYVV